MGKIFYIMGKSASGKDKIYSRLAGNKELNLKKLILYTTRPVRDGEENGKQYYFTDEKKLQEFKTEGKVIEARAYNTVYGVWTYFTADDGQIDLKKGHYLGIGTLESYQKMRNYYGESNVVPVYIEVEDGYDFKQVSAAIKADDYFAHDETHVMQVECVDNLLDMGHGVNLVRKGVSGKTQNQLIEFDMKINNPALTAQILVSVARASLKQQPGAYTMIELPIIDMLYGERENLIRRLV